MTVERVKGTLYDLQTFAGDSGTISVSHIPTDSEHYVIYLEINGNETIKKSVVLNGADNCIFELTPNETLSLGVGTFSYGIKICNTNNGDENTYVPNLCKCNRANFIVYPERAEGIVNV